MYELHFKEWGSKVNCALEILLFSGQLPPFSLRGGTISVISFEVPRTGSLMGVLLRQTKWLVDFLMAKKKLRPEFTLMNHKDT